jgi:hypothetical protein
MFPQVKEEIEACFAERKKTTQFRKRTDFSGK